MKLFTSINGHRCGDKLRRYLPLIACLLVGFSGKVALDYASRATDLSLPQVALIDIQPGDIVIGEPAAPGTILVFVSLTCSHCRAWEAGEMASVMHDTITPGRARLVIRDFPLDASALDAAALVRCLPAEQRAAAHHRLMQGQDIWSPSSPKPPAIRAATYLGLSGEAAKAALACASAPGVRLGIAAGQAEARSAYNIAATPGFVVGHRVHVGGMTSAEITAALEPGPIPTGS